MRDCTSGESATRALAAEDGEDPPGVLADPKKHVVQRQAYELRLSLLVLVTETKRPKLVRIGILLRFEVRDGEEFASGMTATGFWIGIAVGRIVLGFVTPRLGEKLAISVSPFPINRCPSKNTQLTRYM